MECETVPTISGACLGAEPVANAPEPGDDESAIPSWDGMPKSKPILVLSWEDIYPYARDNAREYLGREPTKDDVRDIFERIDRVGMDSETDSFWGVVGFHTDEYYSNLSKQTR